MDPATDSDILRRQAYLTDEMLSIRFDIHERYSVPRLHFPEWVLTRIKWRGKEIVLDLGCGPGAYARALRRIAPGATYYGIDFSAGMLQKHPAQHSIALADAQKLPFADHSFDVVMANHVLYHLPDIDHAIGEIRRMMRPDGILIAATNSSETMPQFRDLFKRAIMVLTAPGKQITVPLPASHAFTLESGTRQLARSFFAVTRYDLPQELVFDDLDPVIAYLETSRSLLEPQLPAGVSWDAVMMIVREQIRNQMNYLGQLVVKKISGVLIASDRGGFIGDYVRTSER